jgi:para-aminobenzoate synthetase component 1
MTMELLWHPLSARPDIADAFVALYGTDPHALWFDDHGERGRGMSYLASGRPLDMGGPSWRESLRVEHRDLARLSSVPVGSLPLGIVVMVPYELGTDTLGLPEREVTPKLRALRVDRLIAINHQTGEFSLHALGSGWDGELAAWREGVEAALADAPVQGPPVVPHQPAVVWRDSTDDYREIIGLAQEAIRQGDAYQLCVTTQLSIDATVDPIALHRQIRETNPTHHQALVRSGEISLVCASPETFLDITRDGLVTTRPIKGTRPRGAAPEQDRALAVELIESEKERAENLMIVDLMRNDLSHVCEVGTLSVPELLVLESYASVHQLVSTVTGQLRKDADLIDVLDATFPAGSMTGAPKRRAVELLGQWESGPRGYYSGIIGVWRSDGSATLAMTIRTAVVTNQGLSIGVGGGITALSEPDSEITEVGIKAMPFLRALGHSQVQYS